MDNSNNDTVEYIEIETPKKKTDCGYKSHYTAHPPRTMEEDNYKPLTEIQKAALFFIYDFIKREKKHPYVWQAQDYLGCSESGIAHIISSLQRKEFLISTRVGKYCQYTFTPKGMKLINERNAKY